ncbi:BlaI/MecI/CopY family transcriptional regulator [soil metagenome]
MRSREGLLTRREQQIMEVVYAQGRVAASEIESALPDRPSNSTVRTLLKVLEEKGWLLRVEENGRYLYSPSKPKEAEGRSALRRVMDTFFAGSVKDAVAGLLDEREKLSPEEVEALLKMIEERSR